MTHHVLDRRGHRLRPGTGREGRTSSSAATAPVPPADGFAASSRTGRVGYPDLPGCFRRQARHYVRGVGRVRWFWHEVSHELNDVSGNLWTSRKILAKQRPVSWTLPSSVCRARPLIPWIDLGFG